MSILKKMLVRIPTKKSYLAMAWDATAKGQTDLATHLFKLAYAQETTAEKKAEAAWNIYVDCKNKEKYNEAYLWCERTALLGYVKAIRILGKAHFYGLGIVPNYRKAVKWFKTGAEKGDAVCMRLLGECYARGKGVLKNERKAYEYFRQAYELKEKGSFYWMGLAYRFGSAGYEKDPAKAMRIWNEGVPDSRCLFELGKCYFWGEVVPEDHALAYDYMKKVSDHDRDFADDYLSPDKKSLRTKAEVEALINFKE